MWASSRRPGLYKSLLRDRFLVGWFKLIEFEVLIGGIPFLLGQTLVSRKFVGDYHVRSALPANLILRSLVHSVITWIWFSLIIYWQTQIFTCTPHFLERGQDKLRDTFQQYIKNIFYLAHFFVCRWFLFY